MDRTTLPAALRRTVTRHPDVVAIIDGDRRIPFGALDESSSRLASSLLRMGIGRGDHVGIWMSTRSEWIVAFCACTRIGAVVVPINTRYTTQEAAYIIGHADIRLLLCEARMWQSDAYAMLLAMAPDLARGEAGALRLDRFPLLRTVAILGGDAPAAGTVAMEPLLSGAMDEAGVAHAEKLVTEADPLLICFTSGSTGKPKGVVHAHRVIAHSERIGNVLHMQAGDVHLANWPLYHVAGLFIVLVPAVVFGSTMALMAHWDGAKALALIERERVGIVGGISTHYFDLVEEMEKSPRDTACIKAGYIGGATLAAEAFERILGTLRLPRLLSTYGMTENTVSTTMNDWDDPADVCRQNMARPITSGAVKVVDAETLQDAPPGSEGEIWCSGPTVMLGYYRQPEATAQALTPDGWLRTGDLGRFTPEGFLRITGRIKDIIKVGGTNVAPAEVEGVLQRSPDVDFAVVVGVPHARLGEVPYAYVKMRAGARAAGGELLAFCARHLANYKVPKHVRFMDEMPRLSTGKIDRKQLGDAARAAVGEDRSP
jgi:fatty-acyl-CoA synthase